MILRQEGERAVAQRHRCARASRERASFMGPVRHSHGQKGEHAMDPRVGRECVHLDEGSWLMGKAPTIWSVEPGHVMLCGGFDSSTVYVMLEFVRPDLIIAKSK